MGNFQEQSLAQFSVSLTELKNNNYRNNSKNSSSLSKVIFGK